MNELIFKYNLLDKFGQQEVKDFIDFLLNKKMHTQQQNLTDYKKKILNVSVWTDEDIQVFDDNSKKMNEWKVPEW